MRADSDLPSPVTTNSPTPSDAEDSGSWVVGLFLWLAIIVFAVAIVAALVFGGGAIVAWSAGWVAQWLGLPPLHLVVTTVGVSIALISLYASWRRARIKDDLIEQLVEKLTEIGYEFDDAEDERVVAYRRSRRRTRPATTARS